MPQQLAIVKYKVLFGNKQVKENWKKRHVQQLNENIWLEKYLV